MDVYCAGEKMFLRLHLRHGDSLLKGSTPRVIHAQYYSVLIYESQ